MSDKNSPVIDLEHAISLVGGNKDIVLEIIGDFKREIPEFLSTVENQYKTEDYAALVATVHKMSGGAAYIGARHLREVSKQLEQKFKTENSLDHGLYKEILSEVAKVLIFEID